MTLLYCKSGKYRLKRKMRPHWRSFRNSNRKAGSEQAADEMFGNHKQPDWLGRQAAFTTASFLQSKYGCTEAMQDAAFKHSPFSHWLWGQVLLFRAMMVGKVFLFPADTDLINCGVDIPQTRSLMERNSKQWYNSTGHSWKKKNTSNLLVPFGQVWFSKDITPFNEEIHGYYHGSWGWVLSCSAVVNLARALHRRKKQRSPGLPTREGAAVAGLLKSPGSH